MDEKSGSIKPPINASDPVEFQILAGHVGHEIECVTYGRDETVNVSVECLDCGEVITDADRYPEND